MSAPEQPSEAWALLGYQRPDGQEITVTLYGCQACGVAVWDRTRHKAACPQEAS